MKRCRYLLVFIIIINLTVSEKIQPTKEQMWIMGFGSPIVDGVINFEENPIIGERIKSILDYHMSGNFPLHFYAKVMDSKDTAISLGGSAMNAIRAANFVLRLFKSDLKPVVGFIGSIGNDKYGDLIKSGLNNENIKFYAEEFKEQRTSTSIVLIQNRDRALYSDLGASEKISMQHFYKISGSISKVKIFHADAYLIGKRFECYKYIYHNFQKDNILFSLNMAADFIIRDYYHNIKEILPLLDIIFLNESEVQMWKSQLGIQNDTMSNIEFFDILSEQIEKINKNKKSIIVNTRGVENTIVYVVDYLNNKKENFSIPIIDIDKNLIIDLNGAGDAFAGGFLAGFLLDRSIEDCARLGNQLASEIIQLKGFQLPTAFTKINMFEYKSKLPNYDL